MMEQDTISGAGQNDAGSNNQHTLHLQEYINSEITYQYKLERTERGEWGKIYSEQLFDFRMGHNNFGSNEDLYPSTEFVKRLFYPYEPEWSGIVPVALLSEPMDTVVSVLESLANQCDGDAGSAEIVLWTNARFPAEFNYNDPFADTEVKAFMSNTRSVYEDFVEELRTLKPKFDADNLGVRTVLHFLDPKENFNQIRSNSIAAVAFEGILRHFSTDHHIGLIDTDSPFITEHAIRDLRKGLWMRKAHFMRANLLITEDDPATLALPLAHRSNGAKVAGVYGVARYMLESNLGFTDPRGYVDESGMFFTTDDYLTSSGIGVLNPKKGESKTLLAHASTRLDTSIPLLGYEKNAVIGNSNRRFKWLAGRIPPVKLPDCIEGDDYVDFQSMDKNTPERTEPVTVGDVWEMVDYMETTQKKRTEAGQPGYTREQRERLGAHIAACAFANFAAEVAA